MQPTEEYAMAAVRYHVVVGQRFGRFVVLDPDLRLEPTDAERPRNARGPRAALVQCVCGTEKLVRIMSLGSGASQSCGCLRRERAAEALRSVSRGPSPQRGVFKHVASVGQRFGRLVVLETDIRLEPSPSQRAQGNDGHRVARAQCDCGSPQKLVRIIALCRGDVTSCGCWMAEARSRPRPSQRTHGLSADPQMRQLYNTWYNVKRRTTDPRCDQWRHYGGRGITLDERWLDPAVFVADILATIGPRPSRAYSLDRVNNDMPYVIGNLRWATASEQAYNRRPHSDPDCACVACVANRRRGEAQRLALA